MKVGLNLGPWGASGLSPGATEQVIEADRLGLDSVWTAETYGSDVFTPLAWLGSRTTRIRLGTAVAQIPARTPAATAMTALTLDHLSDGRFVLGLGTSGPQVVEGWHGVPFAKPLARSREYVEIVRQILAREERVQFDGEHYQLPLRGGTGLGKPLKSVVHPLRADTQIFLGAEGPRNVAQTAEIADGWLALFYSPDNDGSYREALAEGFARPGARRHPEDFEIVCNVPLSVDDDLERAADRVRPFLALYIGGMGAKGRNFHYDVFARMGYEDACETIQDHYLGGRREDAVAAVPTAMVDDIALIGSLDRVLGRLPRWQETQVTTMLMSGPVSLLIALAEAVA